MKTKLDTLMDELLQWCDENKFTGLLNNGIYMDFTFGDLKELIIRILESDFYQSLKHIKS